MNEPKADLTLRSVKIPLEQCLGVEEKAVQTPSRESDIANAAPQSCGDCAQRCLRDKRCEAPRCRCRHCCSARVLDRLFRDDLMMLATDGLPLWDGMADLEVRPAFPEEEARWRPAFPEEEARWRASRAKAIRHGNIEREDDTWIAFLVALTDFDRRRG